MAFFATNHGKQPCDVIGGTVKRLATKASLQRTTSKQIMSPIEMFQFCIQNIAEIKFFYSEKGQIERKRAFLEKRFEGTFSVPGTRTFHQFIPVSDYTVAAKRCSDDNEHVLQHDLLRKPSVLKI